MLIYEWNDFSYNKILTVNFSLTFLEIIITVRLARNYYIFNISNIIFVKY